MNVDGADVPMRDTTNQLSFVCIFNYLPFSHFHGHKIQEMASSLKPALKRSQQKESQVQEVNIPPCDEMRTAEMVSGKGGAAGVGRVKSTTNRQHATISNPVSTLTLVVKS